jgi:hypothetical protein
MAGAQKQDSELELGTQRKTGSQPVENAVCLQ